eukprot:TRINITY_DN17585_c0_g1_i1.p1 TRINITY_DN17585_c0_g1~~TRINITY_DN17585_c0_g1_i1.p1  ORF type:complete len:490 (-),score=100.86 TRINITY_DN17585_c0_g1_i1:450-1853(-)
MSSFSAGTAVAKDACPIEVWPISTDDAATLQRVVIVHRHGARFPNKPAPPEDLYWPKDAAFWKNFAGQLTPHGSEQLRRLGVTMRHRYGSEGAGLLPTDGNTSTSSSSNNSSNNNNNNHDSSLHVIAHSSGKQRALQSAWAFINGLVPDSPVILGQRGNAACQQRAAVATQHSVPIFLEPKESPLVCGWEGVKDEYDAWHASNKDKSPELQAFSQSDPCCALLDKLYEMTGCSKVAPGEPLLKRITACKTLDALAAIAECLKQGPALANTKGLELKTEERKLLAEISWELKRVWFRDSTSGLVRQSFGKQAAGSLSSGIARLLRGSGSDCSGSDSVSELRLPVCSDSAGKQLHSPRITVISAHDKTLAALACHLSMELPCIGFGAALVFELHSHSPSTAACTDEPKPKRAKKQDPDGDLQVKLYYNGDPFCGGRWDGPKIPAFDSDKLQAWSELSLGSFALSVLEDL